MMKPIDFSKLFRNWTDEEIIEHLTVHKRFDDLQLFKKFLQVGFNGLSGGNVVLTDKEPTEYYKICCLLKSFGQLTPDLHFFTEKQFEDIKQWAAGQFIDET